MANEQGYRVILRGFIAVDPDDLNDHGQTLDALRAMTRDKDFGQLTGLLEIEELSVKFVARRTKAEGEGEAAKEPAVPAAAVAPAKAAA